MIVWDDENKGQGASSGITWDDEIGSDQNSQPQASNGLKRPINPMEIAKNTALDPFLAPINLSSSQRQMQDMYMQGREGILESQPMKSMRSGLSTEKAPINRMIQAQNPAVGLGMEIGNQSPQELAKQAQGLVVDVASGLGGDVLAAKTPGIFKGLINSLGKTQEGLAARFINAHIKPRQSAYNFGRNPGKTVAEYIGTTSDRQSLFNKVSELKENFLSQLEESAKTSNTPVDVTVVFKQIANEVGQMRKLPRTYAEQIDTHMNLAYDLKDTIEKHATIKNGKIFVDPVNAINIKRILGQLPSWSANDPKLGTVTKTARKAYGAFDKEIDKAIPGAKKLNDDVSNLIGAEQAIKVGQQREQNRNPILNLPNMLLGTAGVFGASGNIPAAAGAAVTAELLRSTPFNTAVASGLSKTGRATQSVGKGVGMLERKSLIENMIERLTKKKSKSSGYNEKSLKELLALK